MDNRPIGVFDSGLGGLTALSRITELLEGERFIYLGDTARVPYGSKSRDELLMCARSDFEFLKSKNVKAVLVACGTVSSNLTQSELDTFGVLTETVVAPAAKKATEVTKNGKIGIIATAASIRAGSYEAALNGINQDIEVFSVACPEFVTLVESGLTSKSDPKVAAAAQRYLISLRSSGIDTLILGCTHYPLLADVISELLPDTVFVDVGREAAEALADKLRERSMLADGKTAGCKFFTTSDPSGFLLRAQMFFKKKIEKVETVVI